MNIMKDKIAQNITIVTLVDYHLECHWGFTIGVYHWGLPLGGLPYMEDTYLQAV